MHAAVLHETGKPLQVERVHLADLGPRDVLIRLGASGLCHTDLEVMRGSLLLPLPIVLGHEGAGRVEAVGRDVTRVRSGDHVVCSWSPNCGQCYYCDHDQPILCERVVAAVTGGHLPDGRSRLRLGDGTLHHFSGVSSHAEYCVVRARTSGRGADYVFEAAGTEASLQQALEAARPGATVVILGKTAVNARVSLRFGSLMGEKRIVRSSYGGARPRVDFPRIAQAYLDGQLRLDELITHRLGLADINAGFEGMERGEVTRAVVVF